jgi:cytochrome b6
MAKRKEWVSAIFEWLDVRLGLEAMGALAEKKDVPVHRHTIWYYLGGMTLFLFMIQVATGILLLFYYRPSADQAYESVQFLMAEVEFGWLIRSVHAWSANLMIFTAFLHLFSVMLMRAYRRPREITWFSGLALLAIAMAFGFTGYLLPWNELAYFATRVGTHRGCRADCRVVHRQGAARRKRCHRCHAYTILRLPCGRLADASDRILGHPPVLGSEARD